MMPTKIVSVFFTGCKGLYGKTLLTDIRVFFFKAGHTNISF